MEITKTLHVTDRAEWRQWLAEHHMTEKEIWLVYYTKGSGKQQITYLDAVEEALCFGWIDGIAKKFDPERSAQRFTPRRPKSNWTELNKERVRRLMAEGKMTAAGLAAAPDLVQESFYVAPDILAALQSDAQTWHNYQQFPELYKRIRVGFVEEVRRQPAVFQQRLAHFLKKTRENKMFGTMQ